MTINNKKVDKALLAFAIKTTNKLKKRAGNKKEEDLAILLVENIRKEIDKTEKIINHNTSVDAEKAKDRTIKDYINNSRKQEKWLYLASSHNDSAKDHKDWQGKMYVDEKAPEEVIEYARSKNLRTIQWVMGDPVWFITRPNCRHYFVSLTLEEVKGSSLSTLKNRHKTHSDEGNREYRTPKGNPIEVYEERLATLEALCKEQPTEELEKLILKTKLLIKKWRKLL